MRKSAATLLLFLLLGITVGSVIAHLLEPVPWLTVLTKSVSFAWEPQADLNVIKYDFHVEVNMNLCIVLALAAAIWIYRKM